MSGDLSGDTQAGAESLASFIHQSGGKLAQTWWGLSWAWGIAAGAPLEKEKGETAQEMEKEQPVRPQEDQQGDNQGLEGGREMSRWMQGPDKYQYWKWEQNHGDLGVYENFLGSWSICFKRT